MNWLKKIPLLPDYYCSLIAYEIKQEHRLGRRVATTSSPSNKPISGRMELEVPEVHLFCGSLQDFSFHGFWAGSCCPEQNLLNTNQPKYIDKSAPSNFQCCCALLYLTVQLFLHKLFMWWDIYFSCWPLSMTPHWESRCRELGYYLPFTHTFLIKAANFVNAYSWSHSEGDPAEYREKKCLEW